MNDLTMTVKIDAPNLVSAIMQLAAAVSSAPDSLPLDASRPQLPDVASTPSAPPVAPQLPATVPTASAAVPPAPAVPVAGAPAYTLDQIAKAGATLVDAGKMEPLMALLAKYGVQAITQLQPAQYGLFATELRALGAQI